jgi:hypothetical protein
MGCGDKKKDKEQPKRDERIEENLGNVKMTHD